jgi:hypothetical protein
MIWNRERDKARQLFKNQTEFTSLIKYHPGENALKFLVKSSAPPIVAMAIGLAIAVGSHMEIVDVQSSSGSLLTAVAIITGGLLALFPQFAKWREDLTIREIDLSHVQQNSNADETEKRKDEQVVKDVSWFQESMADFSDVSIIHLLAGCKAGILSTATLSVLCVASPDWNIFIIDGVIFFSILFMSKAILSILSVVQSSWAIYRIVYEIPPERGGI